MLAYENFLGNEIAARLQGAAEDVETRSVSLDDSEQGLGDANLDWADVVIWWGHVRQSEVTPETAERVLARVREGHLHLIALHSAHWATPFVEAMNWRSREDAREHIAETEPGHIVKVELAPPPRPYTVPTHSSALTPATFCYNGYVAETTSHAAQLAKAVCFFSPWQFLFWYDQPSSAQGESELEFFRRLPTTWDETRVLHGKIGEFAVIARRNGAEWFIGCVNAVAPRVLPVSLDFLPVGRPYTASIYRDDPAVPTRTHVAIQRREVDSTSVIDADMGLHGGMAVRLAPAEGR